MRQGRGWYVHAETAARPVEESQRKAGTINQASPVAVVTGVGPGTGLAIVRRFARGGYAVAMPAHSHERLLLLEREIAHARAYSRDVTEEAQLDATLEAIRGIRS